MNTKNRTKRQRDYRLEDFENFRAFGLEEDPPVSLIEKVSEFILQEFKFGKYELQLVPNELDFVAHEMSTMALAIQAFAINCLKITPLENAPVNVTHEIKAVKFKENIFMNFDALAEIKKADDKYFDVVNKLYHLKEINPTLVKNISVKIELTKDLDIELEKQDFKEDINILVSYKKRRKLSGEEEITLSKLQEKLRLLSQDKRNNLTQEFDIPVYLHNETISNLTQLIENLTGNIAMHTNLNARKDWAEKIILNFSIDAIIPYLRKYIYPTARNYSDIKYAKQQEPKKEEFRIIALILTAAGILPTEDVYPTSKFVRKNGTRPVNPDDQDAYFKKAKINKKRNRDYQPRMIEVLKETYQQAAKENIKVAKSFNPITPKEQPQKSSVKEGYPYYQGYSGYFNIKDIITPFSQELQRILP